MFKNDEFNTVHMYIWKRFAHNVELLYEYVPLHVKFIYTYMHLYRFCKIATSNKYILI